MNDLQNLYLHLEHCHSGDRYMAYYGQVRAEGKSHDEAIQITVDHFQLKTQDWYQNRMNR